MKVLYLDPDLNNLLDIAYNPGKSDSVDLFDRMKYADR